MTKETADFGAKLAELETITAWFESDEVDLNAALAKFERGMQLADELKRELQQVENRVEKIKARFDAPADAPAAPDETASIKDDDTDTEEPTLFP
jgi:exodeoxyribonuclease VII small subunit